MHDHMYHLYIHRSKANFLINVGVGGIMVRKSYSMKIFLRFLNVRRLKCRVFDRILLYLHFKLQGGPKLFVTPKTVRHEKVSSCFYSGSGPNTLRLLCHLIVQEEPH